MRGFTLTELLVVIAILAVLSSLSLVMVSKVRATADRAVCTDIMRQHGLAMVAYLGDNNNMLPEIGVNLQKPNYRHEGDWHIFAKLFPYHGLEAKSETTALPDGLVCPSFRKKFSNWNSDGTGAVAGNAYFMNQDQSIGGRRIWGTQSGQRPVYSGSSYSSIARGTTHTRLPEILFLADGHHPTEHDDPVHGSHRCYLFMDFHAECRLVGQLESTISP